MMTNYYLPTPKKWRKIGDSVLFLSVSMNGLIMGLPLTDNQKVWAIFGCSLAGVFGKTITNFFKEDEPQQSQEQPKS